jgi:hypothetical protein
METYTALPPTTRVWIYQSNRAFTSEEANTLQEQLEDFARQWVSHNRQLRSRAEIRHNRFIVLMVDESQADASGCSIDSSVHFLKQLESEYQLDLFDRMTFAYWQNNQLKTADRDGFLQLYNSGEINDNTLVFDNLIQTKGQLDSEWLKPLHKSWHKRMV